LFWLATCSLKGRNWEVRGSRTLGRKRKRKEMNNKLERERKGKHKKRKTERERNKRRRVVAGSCWFHIFIS